MTHKLTKNQLKVWNEIEPIIKEREYSVELTFDDEFEISTKIPSGNVRITISPNGEVLYFLERNSGGFQAEFIRNEIKDNLSKKLN